MKKPPSELAEECLRIRCASKSGQEISLKEHFFCRKMLKEYPEWYNETEGTVFNRTVPFGSRARWEDRNPNWKDPVREDDP